MEITMPKLGESVHGRYPLNNGWFLLVIILMNMNHYVKLLQIK